ncbi:membrane protein YqaA, SNARE-associated domain [Halopseudomonas litoralis]|uniref:Membrane protein YqaA, SNARE-associated domain n=1 Tax=Halopseudomonas litoralis TaxID=797277 RepID=A0A1H1PI55_9GAMM|nr:YqaA family protein [Halopseudomonas litoralis]SDS10922.1 membrane protein YqaA, SNARE-associated domain [Halopseudomonas litoralis]
MWEVSGYLGLFLAALVAATFLPMQSEVVLVGLQLAGQHSLALLLLVATVGNVLGSLINWLLGRYIERWRERRWFPVPPDKLAKAQRVYQRYGYWSLLLSWAPFIGDPLTLMAGVLREPLWRFLLIVTVAKAGRYLLLMAVTAQLI